MNKKMRGELDGLHDRIRHGEEDYHNHHKRIKGLESDNHHSRNNQDDLNRDIDDVEHRIRDVSAKINVLDGKIRGLKVDLDHLEATVGDLTGKHDAEHDLYTNIKRDLGKENDTNKALQEDHKRLVEAIEDGRRALDDLRREIEDLNDKVRCVTSTNADLEYQIAELNRHIDVLTQQNNALNMEIDEVINLDRRVREELDRRATIAEKQKMNEEKLRESIHSLQRARHSSPSRS